MSIWTLNYTGYVAPNATSGSSGSAPTVAVASAALPSPTAFITVASGTGVYLGCVGDNGGNRALSYMALNNQSMTNDQCATLCQAKNYAFFGTE